MLKTTANIFLRSVCTNKSVDCGYIIYDDPLNIVVVLAMCIFILYDNNNNILEQLKTGVKSIKKKSSLPYVVI